MDLNQEKQLLKEAKTDSEAYLRLFDHYFPLLHDYCLNRTGDIELSKKLVRETMNRSLALVKEFDLKNPYGLAPLLFATANEQIRKLNATLPERLGAEIIPLEQQTLNVLGRIDERYAELIALKYYTSLNAAEISITLGIKASEVPPLLVKALAAFREEFKKSYPETEIFYSN